MYDYPLPQEAIATFPCTPRDHAKLLVYDQKTVHHHKFYELPDLLPKDSTLFLNQSAVIPIRLHLQKSTGAKIEIFIIGDDTGPSHLSQILKYSSPLSIRAWFRPSKRLRVGEKTILRKDKTLLSAERLKKEQVNLEWKPRQKSFAHILHMFGKTPLPPYINREEEASDLLRYQTVFHQHPGSAAAPTAGLHFTDTLLQTLHHRNIPTHSLTLHVGAGTFLPLRTLNIEEHAMHAEEFLITEELLQSLQSAKTPISVGTTTFRAIESVYWLGCMLAKGQSTCWIPADVYRIYSALPVEHSLREVEKYIRVKKLKELRAVTSLFIRPDYQTRILKGLITNFHQPCSTLLVLVATLVGPVWHALYTEALQKQYRFLSYGDACFFKL